MPDLDRLRPDQGLSYLPPFDEREVLLRVGTMLEARRPQTGVGRHAGGADGRAG